MPRQVRIEFPGASYHVMCRGDRREAIFADDKDRECFIETLARAGKRCGWRIHAYVLMGNHYHLLVETPQPNLVRGMTWFQTTYTVRYNARHKTAGHLYGGRYKAVLVETAGGGGAGEADCFSTLLDYIHLNPVRAGLAEDLLSGHESGSGRGGNYSGAELRDHGTRRAERIIAAGLDALELDEVSLREMKKSADEKMLIAAIVREETPVKARWLAGKLRMGSVANVSRASREIARRLPGDRNPDPFALNRPLWGREPGNEILLHFDSGSCVGLTRNPIILLWTLWNS